MYRLKNFVITVIMVCFICGFSFAQDMEVKNELAPKDTDNFISGRNAIGAFLFTPVEFEFDDFFYGISYQRWIVPEFALEFGGMVVGSGVNEISYNFVLEGDWAFFEHISNENFDV
ncbi:MAG: hypothetical protein SPI86_09235 [Treponemataceae bacterium]|nr:hypothetical protein [Spirochaetales bacterium]MDY6031923.1 hypothetical protein [Treponemataceae bacterium]